MALRESIVDAALAVVSERGLDGASYDVIAARAGASVDFSFHTSAAAADALLQSWTYWQYKYFADVTTTSSLAPFAVEGSRRTALASFFRARLSMDR